ncbi:uncharacterized protein GGS25DRAFT_275855 [Hypoxylon fragiforme]|uniref:uncharacterized protein n=1 Tax=Hypoxylon fragiforme TaxID=63214 RepID=UPI0020C71044|nr:uncharacterized protein GGS25DRAFT_275855 [Hypoxylon fragiforme]KAI2608426.1 hypothetical protein GGS25DRAFT_275855 [Hypoxylon fragiforme]
MYTNRQIPAHSPIHHETFLLRDNVRIQALFLLFLVPANRSVCSTCIHLFQYYLVVIPTLGTYARYLWSYIVYVTYQVVLTLCSYLVLALLPSFF